MAREDGNEAMAHEQATVRAPVHYSVRRGKEQCGFPSHGRNHASKQ